MRNNSNRSHAVTLFAAYLKRQSPRFHGMSIERINKIVRNSISGYGPWTEPQYRTPYAKCVYVRGALCEWNPKGGFFRTVSY